MIDSTEFFLKSSKAYQNEVLLRQLFLPHALPSFLIVPYKLPLLINPIYLNQFPDLTSSPFLANVVQG